jgi:hypothetical protein
VVFFRAQPRHVIDFPGSHPVLELLLIEAAAVGVPPVGLGLCDLLLRQQVQETIFLLRRKPERAADLGILIALSRFSRQPQTRARSGVRIHLQLSGCKCATGLTQGELRHRRFLC